MCEIPEGMTICLENVLEWMERCGEYIGHIHIHNNDGTKDQHQALNQRTIPMEKVLRHIAEKCPDASCTLELMDAESSLCWIEEIC